MAALILRSVENETPQTIMTNIEIMNKELVLKKIKTLKQLCFGGISIPLEHNNLAFRLRLLTADKEADNQIIELLANWREANEKYFPAVFKVTFEGTRKWYRDRLINEPDRLLFMIEANGEYIGHVGLYRFNFERDMCDIDNILRGVDKYPGIMGTAIAGMMRWGHKELGIKRYSLDTSTDCSRAVKVYERVGFVEKRRDPVIQIRNGDRLEWIFPEQGKDYEVLATRDNIYMECEME